MVDITEQWANKVDYLNPTLFTTSSNKCYFVTNTAPVLYKDLHLLYIYALKLHLHQKTILYFDYIVWASDKILHTNQIFFQ